MSQTPQQAYHFLIYYLYQTRVGEQVDCLRVQMPESLVIRNLPYTCHIYHLNFFRRDFIFEKVGVFMCWRCHLWDTRYDVDVSGNLA